MGGPVEEIKREINKTPAKHVVVCTDGSSRENQSMSETCVLCGKETEYDINTPLEVRRWYVEGSGQLCGDCWYKLWPTRT